MRYALLTCLVLTLLSACGGGGGGSPDVGGNIQSLPFGEKSVSAAERSASSIQTASAIGNTSARTDFSPNHTEVIVTRSNGRSFVMDTRQHQSVIEAAGTSQVTGSGRTQRRGVIYNPGGGAIGGVSVLVDWNNSDPTDYVAGGYWLYDTPSEPVEIGAFISGPELSGNVTLPVTGTATYTGMAGGIYTWQHSLTSYETGQYLADALLTADFTAMMISGHIDVTEFHSRYTINTNPVDVPRTGDNREDDGEPMVAAQSPVERTNFRLTMPAVTIQQDGSFSGNNAVLSGPSHLPIRSTSGSWDGRFSTRSDGAGNPRMVAGRHGGTAILGSDVSNISFVGAFYGATSEFRTGSK